MTDDSDRSARWLTRRLLLSTIGGVSGGLVGANSIEDGYLTAGDAALQEAYNVSGDLWIGPESALADVPTEAGRVYLASDTNVSYYSDDSSWGLMAVGSDATKVPEVNSESVSVGENTRLEETAGGNSALTNEGTDTSIMIEEQPSGAAYLTGNTQTTTVSVQDEWTPIAGSWAATNLNQVTLVADGGLKYEGGAATQLQFTISGAYTAQTANETYQIAIFEDGQLRDRTQLQFEVTIADELSSLPTVTGMTDDVSAGTVHRPMIRSTTGAEDITIVGIDFVVRG